MQTNSNELKLWDTFYEDIERQDTVPNILYGDTDSLFIKLFDYNFLNELGLDLTNEETVKKLSAEFIDPLAKDINEFLRENWQNLVLNVQNVSPEWNKLDFKSEIVMDFIALSSVKKRYFLNMIKDDKVIYREPKVKITGFDAVRSDVAPFSRDMQMDIIKSFIENRKDISKIPKVFTVKKKEWNDRYEKAVKELDLKYIGIPSSWSKKNYKKEPSYVLGARLWNTFVKDELRPGKKSYRISIKVVNRIKLEQKVKEIREKWRAENKQPNSFQLNIFDKKIVQFIVEKVTFIFVPPLEDPKHVREKLNSLGIDFDFKTHKNKVFIEKLEIFEEIVENLRKSSR